jgi:hypothetical protein
MQEIVSVMPVKARENLATLIGHKLEYISGFGVKRFLTAGLFIIATDNGVTDIRADLMSADFPGYAEEFGYFRSGDALESDLISAETNGTRFFRLAGGTIKNITVRSETITKIVDQNPSWSYASDVAVIFVLSNGVFSISKIVHIDEVLTVTYAESLEHLDIPETGSLFENGHNERYEIEVHEHDISDAQLPNI